MAEHESQGQTNDEKKKENYFSCIDVNCGTDVNSPKSTQELVPIVYTTKLDDMLIFNKKIHPHTNFKKIIERIQEESKPVLEKLKKVPRNLILEYSYNVLKEKILEINSLRANESLESINSKIDNYVTVERVVELTSDFADDNTDIDLIYVPEIRNNTDEENVNNSDDDLQVTFDIEDEDDFQPNYFNANSLNSSETGDNILKEISLVLYNTCNEDADIYYLNKDGCIAEYYKVKSYNDKHLNMYIQQRRAYKFDLCCWYKRNETIKAMFPTFISEKTAKYLNKPHYCISACFCCCRKPNHPITFISCNRETVPPVNTEKFKSSKSKEKIDNPESVQTTKNNILLEILNRKCINSTISMPLKCKETKRTKQINPKLNLRYFLYETFYKVSFSRSIEIQKYKYYNINKLYEIGTYGNLLRYDYDMTGGTRNIPSVQKNCCCWYRHQVDLALIGNQLNTNGSSNDVLATIKYMEIKHSCPIDRCNCCCRSDIFVPLSRLNLPRDFPNPNITPQQYPSEDIIPVVKTSAPTETTGRKHVTKVDKNPLRDAKDENPNQVISCLTVTPSPLSEQTEPQTSSNSDDDVVQHLIGSMLNTFKDVQLTIDENGTVAATLQTPVSSLSAPELKVLSHILAHAQNQVTALRLCSQNENNQNAATVSSQLNQHQMDISNVDAQLSQINSNLVPESQASSSFQSKSTKTVLPKIDQVFSLNENNGNDARSKSDVQLNIKNTQKRKIDNNEIVNISKNNHVPYASFLNQTVSNFSGGPVLAAIPLSGTINTVVPNVLLLNNTLVAKPSFVPVTSPVSLSSDYSCTKKPRILPETVPIAQNLMISQSPFAPVMLKTEVDLGIDVNENEGDIKPDIVDNDGSCIIFDK